MAFTFNLTDNDWFTDKQDFFTRGIIVELSPVCKVALALAKPIGLMWSEYSDVLTKADLSGQASDGGGYKSQKYSSFSVLSSNPAIPVSSYVAGLRLHTARTRRPFSLEQKNLKYYSQNSASSQEIWTTGKLSPRRTKGNHQDGN